MDNYDYAKNFPNDEPATEDKLGRAAVGLELARIALNCKTPMVIGIYGPWGYGKSSFMEFMKSAILEQNKHIITKVVQFNPWQAQFVEEPAVALIEKIARDCDILSEAATEKRISRIFSFFQKGLGIVSTLASAAAVAGVPGAAVVQEVAKEGKEKVDQLSSAPPQGREGDSLSIQEEFGKIIEAALEKSKGSRLVIFVDDLDRCTHEQTMKLLEALKLYLNHDRCVYIIGADPAAIQASIEHHYRDSKIVIKGEDYLDKIIQIPFRLPGISREDKNDYISELLGDELRPCCELMIAGLGDSPRNLKRFALLLKMNYLAGRTHAGYKPETAALFLLIQWISEANRKTDGMDLFPMIARDRKLILQLVDRSDGGSARREEILGSDRKLKKIIEIAMDRANVPRDLAEVDLYIHLARQAGGVEEDMDEAIREVSLQSVIERHNEWLLSNGARGEQAQLIRGQYAKENLKKLGIDLSRGVNLTRANLFGVFMENSNLTGAILYNAIMEEAALSGIILDGADLRRINFRGADLKEASFKSAKMHEADLWLSDLSDAVMHKADLTMASLAKADLTNAQLRGAMLFGANLKGAVLVGADLTKADLTNANLLGADLDGAKLSGCNLKGAYLAGVKNLSAAQFAAAGCRDQCTPPTEFALD